MTLCALVLQLHLPQFFLHLESDTHTDTHFRGIVKTSSGHSKTSKSIKNRKSKFFMKPILSSIFIEESKN